MSFLHKLKNELNVTRTENGAKTYVSTKSAILDLFALGGAARNLKEDQIKRLVIQALGENPVLATKVIFYLGDIRQGQGERRLFSVALREVFNYFNISDVIKFIPEYSLWKVLINMWSDFEEVRDYIVKSVKDGKDALVYKWLPSLRTHGKDNLQAYDIAKSLGLTPKQYRHMLVEGRNRLNLVEVNLTEKNYDAIDYNQVPSKAGVKYRAAFYRNDKTRYTEHVNEARKQAKAVAEGTMKASEVTVKVNAGVLYPHDIISKYKLDGRGPTNPVESTIEALWYSQKDYLKDLDYNGGVMPVIDTSGSMFSNYIGSGTKIMPADVALGFGVYFAERLKGEFKDHFINFSDRPSLQRLVGQSLHQKLNSINYSNWNGSTNIQAVFNLILNTAINNNMSQADLPSVVLIFSDMEFNSCGMNTNLETAKMKFEAAGYTLPNLVFWNVCARNEQVPAKVDDKGVVLVSGYSPSVIKFILTGEITTPYELMLKTVDTPRYAFVNELRRA